ncbi:MAG: FAD-dependent oxidoreductase, partial [Proteobacteria bacterium]|nr:FAD-dependent oxidoreductase [Pseudomonadota bacterium]
MEKIDVVIVGAGLAGLSCAYVLADSGLTVLVIERGDFPGSKNVTGGRIYLAPVRKVLPDLWDEAPLERHVVREVLTLLGEGNSTSFSHYSDKENQPPYSSYTILRSRFDRWFSEKVGEKGVFVIPQKRVDDLLMDGGRVVGVRAGDEEIPAEVVVAADGVLSVLAEKAGLRQPFKPEHFAVGFKEIIR